MKRPVVIVGGGPAGLSTAAALKTAGIEAVILDRDGSVGASWLRRYERLRLHSIRRYSGLAHRAIPTSYPKYVPKDAYARYLQEYAAHFALEIEHGCVVRRVRLAGASGDGRCRYAIETDRGSRECDNVVIATGMYGRPAIPPFDGARAFRGRSLHSSAYRSGAEFAGKRVLVVGLGNTGAEIAADLVERGAATVSISVRTAPPVVPRDFLLTPVQLFGMALSMVPPNLADRIAAAIARAALGDLTRYGLPKAKWMPFTSKRIPVIDSGFAKHLRAGSIAIRPGVAAFNDEGAVYTDGRTEPFESVVYATGYRTGLDELLEIEGLLDDESLPHPANQRHRGVHFVGFVKSHRGELFEIEAQSRRLAAALAT